MVGAGDGPFIGRERELTSLLDRLDGVAQHGRGGAVHVAGEPGVGKTRLIREVVQRTTAEERLVLFGRAYESESSPPYEPIAGPLSRALLNAPPEVTGIVDREPALAALLARASQNDTHPASVSPASPERYLLFDAIANLLVAFARVPSSRGLVLVVDDLHWADQGTLFLYRHLARRAAEEPLLLLATYRMTGVPRSHPLHEVLAELSRERVAERLLLTPLSADEAEHLTRALLDSPSPAFLERIAKQAGGNPFFIEEMVRHRIEHGDGEDGRHEGVPESVSGLIAKRLRSISPPARALAEAVAVLGGTSPVALLALLQGITEEAVLDQLDEVLDAGLAAEGGGGYRFTHEIARQAVLQALGAGQRGRLHRAAGEAIEQLYTGRLDEHWAALAHHFARAAGVDAAQKAIGYAKRAAQQANAVLAFEDSARLYELALQSADRAGGTPAARAELLLGLGEARREAGSLAGAISPFTQAAAEARRAADPSLLARAALGFETARLLAGTPRTGRDDPSIALLDEALQALPPTATVLRAQLTSGLGRVLFFTGEAGRARVLTARALDEARTAGDDGALAFALDARRIVLGGPDDVDERVHLGGELLALTERTGDRAVEVEATRWLAVALAERGDLRGALPLVERHIAVAESLRAPHYRARAATWRVLLALVDGDFPAAERWTREARTLAEAAGDENEAVIAVHQEILARWWSGRTDLEDLLSWLQSLSPRYAAAIPSWWASLAFVHMALGREADARQAFEELARHDFAPLPRGSVWTLALVQLTEVCAFLADRPRALTLLRLLSPYADRHAMAEAAYAGPLMGALATLHSTLGEFQAARASLESALVSADATRSPPIQMRLRLAYARLLLQTGTAADLPLARRLRDEGVALATRMGIAETIRTREPALTDPRLETPRVRAAAAPGGLTPRELDVLRLLAAGQGNQEIADTLVLSVRTVERHVANIFDKLDVHSRREARRAAREQRLLGA